MIRFSSFFNRKCPVLHACLGLVMLVGAHSASGYGADGHHTIGAIADRLIAGTNAEAQVKSILGGVTLQDAAVWADCARGVNDDTLKYKINPIFRECEIHEKTQELIAALEDYVARNNKQCQPAALEEICHKGYHYTNIAIQNTAYSASVVGARPTDLVGAIRAAVIVLQGGNSPSPFSFKDKREALLALSHFVGDVHQPLHTGSVYLTKKGQRVNPDKGTYDPATFTRGGNFLLIGGDPKSKLHGAWDDVPGELKPVNADSLALKAQAVPLTAQSLPDWPALWATETLKESRKAFVGLKFGGKTGKTWPVSLPSGYDQRLASIKGERIPKAGARLAQILMTVWP
jgi:S1/P1 Nuclease